MIRLVVSASAAERIEAARAFLVALPAAAEAMVVGASREAADDLVRRVTVTAGRDLRSRAREPTQLAARMAAAELARLGAAPTSALGAAALAARSTFEALGAGELGYFGPVARFPGFASALASTLARAAARARASAGARRSSGTAARPRRRRRAPGALRGRHANRGLADRAALFELATLAAAERDRVGRDAHRLARRADLVTRRAGLRRRRWSRSRARCWSPCPRETIARWPRSGSERAPRRVVRARSARCRTQARRRSGRTRVRERGGGASALAHLREYLFAEAAPAGPAEPGEAVFFSAPGEGREAVEIARRIAEEARGGTPFDRMAVLLRAPQVYSSLFETALASRGHPGLLRAGRAAPGSRPGAPSCSCSTARSRSSRRAASPSTSRSARCPTPGADGAPPRGRQVWVAARRRGARAWARRRAPEAQTPRAADPTERGR